MRYAYGTSYSNKEETDSSAKGRHSRLKQKIFGAALLAFAILLPFLLDGDATACLLLVPAGIGCLLSR